MKQVSIIINGVRYDSVEGENPCTHCELAQLCDKVCLDPVTCDALIGENRHFVKSQKGFEK